MNTMNITLEISMYPLREDYIDQVLQFLKRLESNDQISVQVNALSTQVQGESTAVFNAVNAAIVATFEKEIRASFVMKVLPGDIDLAYNHQSK